MEVAVVTLLLVVIFHKIKTQHHFQIQVMEVQEQILVLYTQIYQTQEF